MRNVIFFLLAASLGLGAIAGVGPFGGLRGRFLGSSDGDASTFWCPMDPEIVRRGVGMCPICNMGLVPFEGEAGRGEPGVLILSDRQVQQAGVRLARAAVLDLVREIDATGRLEINPANRTRVTMRYPGESRIERVHVHASGQELREGEVVVEIDNPTMLARLTEYKGILKRYSQLRREGRTVQAEVVFESMREIRDEFEACGMPPAFLDVLAAKPKHLFTDPLFPIVLPSVGTVLEDPQLTEGQTIKYGQSVLEVADLSELWLYVDLYEHERPFVDVGQVVDFTTMAVPDKVFRTRVRFIEPIVRAKTQTVGARCRVWNEGRSLSPGQFVRARVACPVTQVLAVPESAVLQSGRRAVVIVSEGSGRFRPRIVELGRRHLALAQRDGAESPFGSADERYHEILGGVHDGEVVVVSGNFLLNAEAQFQGVLKKMIEAHEAQADAPEVAPEVQAELDTILTAYGEVTTALVEDDPATLTAPLLELATAADRAGRMDSPLQDSFPRMATAARQIAMLAGALPAGQNEEDPGWISARTHYGSLSREIVFYTRDYAPTRVSSGELHLFSCPMADDFGFDKWLQTSSELANPYMGQWMAECGVAAEFE